MKINDIAPDKHEYLQILKFIDSSPKLLHYSGSLPATRRPTVAIVGTRKPTAYGKDVTYTVAYELARRGVVIVSGLALGVDGIAHRAALDARGTTIAVLANGLPRIYPATHKNLSEEIITHDGAIVTEYEVDVAPRDFQFLHRNRIVSGLADAVIITEAAARSGTLNTARHALEQGKEVFAVPGNITSPMSSGCNALIRSGATPLTRAEDVLEAIAPKLLEPQLSLALGDTPLETTILDLLGSGIRDGEELQTRAGSPASEFNQALTMLEINGAVRALGGNQWTLTN